MNAHLLVAGLLLTARCSSPTHDLAHVPAPRTVLTSSVTASVHEAASSTPPVIPPPVDEGPAPPTVEESPRPSKLAGVTCEIRGAGAPFPVPCDPDRVEVFPKREGMTPLARFDAEEIDVTWGLFEDAGRASVHARSGGVALTGFVDLGAMVFRLRREAMIVPEHVWLKQDAPIKVRRGLPEGASVAVVADLPGVASIPAPILCDAIAFDPVAPDPPSSGTPPTASIVADPVEVLHPRRESLRLRDAPSGRVITTLQPTLASFTLGGTTKNPSFSSLGLEVVERKGTSIRVRFETEFARFDVWVEANAVEASGVGTGAMMGRGCGRIQDFMAKRRRINALTPLRVGKSPTGIANEALVVMKGTPVYVAGESGEFLEIMPFSAIIPPDGLSFWVPKSALE